MTPDEWQTWSSTATALVERDGDLLLDVRFITGAGARQMMQAWRADEMDDDCVRTFVATGRILDVIAKKGWNCLVCDAGPEPYPEIIVAILPDCAGMASMGGGVCHACAVRGEAFVSAGVTRTIGQLLEAVAAPAPVVGHA